MFKVTGKKSGVVWDAEKNKPLGKFTDGVFETDDEETAVRLKETGYTVDGKFKAK